MSAQEQVDRVGRILEERDKLRAQLVAAKTVVEASRAIRAKYPGGKMLWFSEFDAFEKALAAFDKLAEEKG